MSDTNTDKYVLAMYDVRGKQNYIFRGNKIKEIVGGSLIIRDIYKDYLMTQDNKIYAYDPINPDIKSVSDVPVFSKDAFIQRMSEKDETDTFKYNGEVIYDGGGNFLILFRNEAVFKKVTHDFTLRVLKATASLRVIGTCVEIDGFDDYLSDRRRLSEKHRITENTIQNVPRYGSMPVSMVSPMSSLPIVYRGTDYTKEEIELTAEQVAKYKKYKEESEKNQSELDEKILDNIAPEKGKDSHIAVIYVDGNSMGAKVQECTKGCKTYDQCVNALRQFSWKIQQECIESKKDVIDNILKERHKDKDNAAKRRLILGAGDEINIIVAGRDAYDAAFAYLKALGKDQRYRIKDQKYSSCAGVAVFRSHMPYADAYRIAEECCESGKDKMKELKMNNTSFLDFHYCQGATDISLEQIRRDEETEESSRPWLLVDPDKECLDTTTCKIDEISQVISFLQKIAHGNTKGLLTAARDGSNALNMELMRIKAHQNEAKRNEMKSDWDIIEGMDDSKKCKLIYDTVLMYDLWFKGGETGNEGKNADNT